MANELPARDPLRGCLIELDKPRYLRLTIGAFRRMEEISGFRWKSPEFAEWGESLDGLAATVWAGLLHEDPDLTLRRVSELLDNADLWQIKAALEGAVRMAMAPPDAAPNGEAPPLALNRAARRHPPNGTSVGPSPSTISA